VACAGAFLVAAAFLGEAFFRAAFFGAGFFFAVFFEAPCLRVDRFFDDFLATLLFDLADFLLVLFLVAIGAV
jgi:hypothetical protein